MKYGIHPQLITNINIDAPEMMFYLYLPIKMKEDYRILIPKRLMFVKPLIDVAIEDFNWVHNDTYIYLTVKHLFVSPEYAGNREGYHSDGFGTDDINYIWTNKYPTVFCIQPFQLSSECSISMMQMEQQAKVENEITYKENDLLRLDQFAIHKVPQITESGMRTFVKISFSEHKYNLKGNSHNFLFDYNWRMHQRSEVRNHPIIKESDFILDES